VAIPDQPEAAGSVLVMVRPERVEVGRTKPTGTRAGIPVTVQEVIFRGAMVHVGLTTADGAALVAHLTDDRALEGLRPGESAWAGWDRDVAYLVPVGEGHRVFTPDDTPALTSETTPTGGT
jgi:hypothetical protein